MKVSTSSFFGVALISVDDEFSPGINLHFFAGYRDVFIGGIVSSHVQALMSHRPLVKQGSRSG